MLSTEQQTDFTSKELDISLRNGLKTKTGNQNSNQLIFLQSTCQVIVVTLHQRPFHQVNGVCSLVSAVNPLVPLLPWDSERGENASSCFGSTVIDMLPRFHNKIQN